MEKYIVNKYMGTMPEYQDPGLPITAHNTCFISERFKYMLSIFMVQIACLNKGTLSSDSVRNLFVKDGSLSHTLVFEFMETLIKDDITEFDDAFYLKGRIFKEPNCKSSERYDKLCEVRRINPDSNCCHYRGGNEAFKSLRDILLSNVNLAIEDPVPFLKEVKEMVNENGSIFSKESLESILLASGYIEYISKRSEDTPASADFIDENGDYVKTKLYKELKEKAVCQGACNNVLEVCNLNSGTSSFLSLSTVVHRVLNIVKRRPEPPQKEEVSLPSL